MLLIKLSGYQKVNLLNYQVAKIIATIFKSPNCAKKLVIKFPGFDVIYEIVRKPK